MSQRFVRGYALAAVALLFIFAVSGWASEIQVFNQASDNNGGYASQNDQGGLGNFATSYDNFTLASSTSVSRVAWNGSYAFGSGSNPTFVVDFWSNSGNAPSNLLASFTGTGAETSQGVDNLGNPLYSYSLTLGSAFAAAGGTEYWISIEPNLAFPPSWFWETSSMGDKNGYQCFFGACGNIKADLAFSLYSQQQTQTPEPGSMMLLGTGILGLAGTLRRKLRG